MFSLAELKDKIRIAPTQYNLKLNEAVHDEVNRKLSNKVVLNVGLCIAIKDVLSLGESTILPGDGGSHTEVIFRCIVFRPEMGCIVTGKIRSCSREGVHITLGFFDDILIPPTILQHPSRYEETEQAWVWEYPLENDEKHDLFMDIGESIKFRVYSEVFAETSPGNQPINESPHEKTQIETNSPYMIIAAINEPGLGVLSWWDSKKEPEEEAEEVEEVSDSDNLDTESTISQF